MKRLLICLLALAGCGGTLRAGFFSDDKEIQLTKHVAEILRDPSKRILEAQDAFDAGDIDSAIRLFEEARQMIQQIEEQEDTSGSAYASLRLKKFHCISMLDALALQRANTQDRRQAITDTDDLETRLAQERSAVNDQRQAEIKSQTPPKPPTDEDLLAEAEAALAKARQAAQEDARTLQDAQTALQEANAAFAEAAKANTAADAQLFLAGNEAAKTSSDAAKAAFQNAQLAAQKATLAVKNARTGVENAQARQQVAELNAQRSAGAVSAAQQEVDVLRRALAAKAEAAQKAQAELEAKEFLRKQAEAEAARKAREEALAKQKALAEAKARQEAEARQKAEAQAQAEAKAKQEAEAKAKQEAEAKAKQEAEAKAKQEAEQKELQRAIAWAQELWRLKRVDTLETRLAEYAGHWPEEPAFLVLLAKLRLIQGEADDALDIAQVLPAEGDLGAQARLIAAAAYMAKGSTMEAMEVLEAAIKATPKAPAPYFDMAVALLKLPAVDPDRSVAARYYVRSVELGGKRSAAIEQALGMEE